MSKVDNRSRLFAFLIYPDSDNTPEDWKEILKNQHVPCFISPLHIDGYDPEGLGNKPHYHIMVIFEGNKSVEQVKEIRDPLGGVGLEVIKSKISYARYLCHLDEDDKIHYDPNDVIQFGGTDYLSLIMSDNDLDATFCEIEEFIEKFNVMSFYCLTRYCSKYRKDWAKVLRHSGAVYFREVLKSRDWSIQKGYTHIIDPDTGELIV